MKDTCCEGPGEKNDQFKPGDATSMPTKHYDHDNLGKRSKNIIEGPCSAEGADKLYHK